MNASNNEPANDESNKEVLIIFWFFPRYQKRTAAKQKFTQPEPSGWAEIRASTLRAGRRTDKGAH
jgi:hypothetical protein